MEMTFKLKTNRKGDPFIEIIHYDKAQTLHQMVLGRFMDLSKSHGLKVLNPSGYTSTWGDSWEKYILLPGNVEYD